MKRGVRLLSLFLAAAWLGSIPGARLPLVAQSSGNGTVPRGKPIQPLSKEPKAEPAQGAPSKTSGPAATSGTTNAAALTPAAKPGFASVGLDVLATFKYAVPEDAPAAKTTTPASGPAADPDTQIPA
ncbi:MAG: hypothetical protein ACKOKG_05570, partial [Verrucomicrobiota bacterium]